jgi:hypothetical protein
LPVYDTAGTVTPAWTVTDAGSGISSAGLVKRFYLSALSAAALLRDLEASPLRAASLVS